MKDMKPNQSPEDILPPIDDGRMYTPEDVAAILTCSPGKVRYLCASAAFFSKNIGTETRAIWRIPGKELRRYLLHGPRTESK